MPATSAVAAATAPIESGMFAPSAIGKPVIRLPFTSGTVPMMMGLSTMM